jgi:hypothetical protein
MCEPQHRFKELLLYEAQLKSLGYRENIEQSEVWLLY